MVELEVAGVNDQAGGGGDAQPDAIGDGVADVEELDAERADSDLVAGVDGVELDLIEQARVAQLDFEQAAREGRGVAECVKGFWTLPARI